MASSDQFMSSKDKFVQHKHAGCSSCSDDGRYVVGKHYCVVCEMYFCGKCLIYHNKMPSLKSHQVNDTGVCDTADVDSTDNETVERGPTVSKETLKCIIHQGKPIDRFCKDHDEMCCATCAVVKHRLCQVDNIDNIAKDFKTNPEVASCKDALTNVHLQLKEMVEIRTENIECIGKQKLELIENVDRKEDNLIKIIKQLANKSRTEIRDKYEESKTELETEVVCLHVAMTATSEHKAKLENSDNESFLFATTKTSKIVARDGETLVKDMSKGWSKKEIKYEFNKTLEKVTDRMKSFGQLRDDCVRKEFEAAYQRNVNLRHRNESAGCVYDMCLIDSGGLLLVKYGNEKLKLFTTNLEFKDEIRLPGKPVAVCETGTSEVAVRIDCAEVQFISVGRTMQKTSSFTLTLNGYGMAYDAELGEMYACGMNKVCVYNRAGHKLRQYENNTNGEKLFSSCRQIVISMDQNDIYVSDPEQKCVVVLDKNGDLKMKISVPGINDPWPLCLLYGNTILIGGSKSGVFVQIGDDGRMIKRLIQSKTDIKEVYCSAYDHANSRLLIAGYPGASLDVYTICPK